MSPHLRPVGPLPAAVYWRRRAAVAAVVLLLLALLTRCAGEAAPERLAQAGPGPTAASSGPPATERPAGTGSPAPPATPTPSPTPAAVRPCADGALSVDAAPERRRYARGARPVLRLAVRNAGKTACTRPLGGGAVELTVFSGDDRIWSSDDCAPGGAAGPQALKPQQLVVITVTWAARRSRPGCVGDAEAIEPGTYRVIGRVGGLRTPGSSFVVV